MSSEDRRGEFRIEYPISERPVLIIADVECEVLDVSEGGIRFLTPPKFAPPSEEEDIAGTVRFRDGEEFDIEGKVVRFHGRQVAVMLVEHKIPYSKITQEQRRLIAKYRERR